jgi:hypothetical protein
LQFISELHLSKSVIPAKAGIYWAEHHLKGKDCSYNLVAFPPSLAVIPAFAGMTNTFCIPNNVSAGRFIFSNLLAGILLAETFFSELEFACESLIKNASKVETLRGIFFGVLAVVLPCLLITSAGYHP